MHREYTEILISINRFQPRLYKSSQKFNRNLYEDSKAGEGKSFTQEDNRYL